MKQVHLFSPPITGPEPDIFVEGRVTGRGVRSRDYESLPARLPTLEDLVHSTVVIIHLEAYGVCMMVAMSVSVFVLRPWFFHKSLITMQKQDCKRTLGSFPTRTATLFAVS